MFLALVCSALAAAAPGARAAASVVPAQSDAALLLDGSQGAVGLRAFLDAVAQRAPALGAGPRIAALVGPDLLGQPLAWGLAFSGPRALVLWRGSLALTAPVRDAKAARAALQSWLEERGSSRSTRVAPQRGPAASARGTSRAGMVAPVAGSLRLLTASGPNAAALVAALSQVGARKAGTRALASEQTMRPALARLTGPAALILRGDEPVRAAALALEGTPQGLTARGLVLASSPLLESDPPGAGACEGASLLCVRAALGAGGRSVLARAVRAWLTLLLAPGQIDAPDRIAQSAALVAERVVLRSDGADARLLAGDGEAAWALRLLGITEPPPAPAAAEVQGPRSLCVRAEATAAWFATPCATSAPVGAHAAGGGDGLDARLDLAALGAVIAKVTPIDAIRGGAPAAIYAARLLVGNLLRTSGPLHLTGKPHASGAEVELSWPLH